MSALRPLAASCVVAALALGCGPSPGRLMVVVHTDLSVPTELDELVARVRRADGTSLQEVPFRLRSAAADPVDDGSRTMPLAFAVEPREPGTAIEVEIEGHRGGSASPIVSRRVTVDVAAGSTRVLDLVLERACTVAVAGACGEGTTCVDGACVPVPRVDSAALPEIHHPGEELLLDGGGASSG